MTDLDKQVQEYLAKADAAPEGPYKTSSDLKSVIGGNLHEIAWCDGKWGGDGKRVAALLIAARNDSGRIIRALLAERDALRADAEQHVSSALSKAAAVARAACFSLGTPNCGAAAAVAEHAVLQLRRELSEAQEKSGE